MKYSVDLYRIVEVRQIKNIPMYDKNSLFVHKAQSLQSCLLIQRMYIFAIDITYQKWNKTKTEKNRSVSITAAE